LVDGGAAMIVASTTVPRRSLDLDPDELLSLLGDDVDFDAVLVSEVKEGAALPGPTRLATQLLVISADYPKRFQANRVARCGNVASRWAGSMLNRVRRLAHTANAGKIQASSRPSSRLKGPSHPRRS